MCTLQYAVPVCGEVGCWGHAAGSSVGVGVGVMNSYLYV